MSTKNSVNSAARESGNHASICACVNLRRAARAITRIYDRALEPSRLKITQYSVLVNIMYAGPITTSNLARTLKLDRTTLVRSLKALEAAGFTEDSAANDPRERMLAVSVAGRRAVEEAKPYWQAAQKQIGDHLGIEQLAQLDKLVLALEQFPLDKG